MKKLKLFALFAVLLFVGATNVCAQIHVSFNINSQPQWGPDQYNYVEYYYLPELGIYYYAPGAQFIYPRGNQWITTRNLPYQYRHVNLYNTYKVVINEPRPHLRHTYYQSHYKTYKNYRSKQGNIRDSKDPRYANRRNDSRPGHVQDNRYNKNSKNNSHLDNSRNKVIQESQHRSPQPQTNKRSESKDSKDNKGHRDDKGNHGNRR